MVFGAEMALITVNAPDGWTAENAALLSAIQGLEHGTCVTILIHGYRYSPTSHESDPHRRLYSLTARKTSGKSVSWAHYLKLGHAKAGLGIGFAWLALGRLAVVAERAFLAGDALADMIQQIARARPDLRLGMFAHSLGARVALRALSQAPRGSVETLVLLTGAEYRATARAAAQSSAGKTARILNVTSGENACFDLAFRLLAPSRESLGPGLGDGIGPSQAGWVDLKIDDTAHLAGLHAMGYRVAQARHLVCHWSSFTRPGLFPLYRDLLGDQGAAKFEELARALPRPKRSTPSIRASLGKIASRSPLNAGN